MINLKTSGKLTRVRGIANGMEGKNYPFDDCMAFIMECVDKNTRLDYWLFSWVTGDGLTQIYNRNPSSFCEYCVSGFLAGREHIEYVFNAVGYGFEYVAAKQINADKRQYIQKVKDYIDKGFPILVKTTMAETPVNNSEFTYGLFVGYEDGGKTLLLTNPYENIIKYDASDDIKQDWIFIGRKNREIPYEEIVVNAAKNMRRWLAMPEEDGKFYGAAAFRAWADDAENGRFDNEPDLWANYGVYFCVLATNSWANNISDAPHASLLSSFARINPQFAEITGKAAELFFNIGNGDGAGGIWKELQDLGGGFNVNNEAFRDEKNKRRIADKLREAARCMEEIERLLNSIWR
jgi:hypothetical protein